MNRSFIRLQARQWSDKVIKTVIRRNWTVHGGVVDKEVQMMVTPRVVEEVRKHFNCSYLEGAELEDQGEDGTALTHWEKRIFEVIIIYLFIPITKNDIINYVYCIYIYNN